MFGEKKVKIPFGKRPSRGSFGKKPSNGSFGKQKKPKEKLLEKDIFSTHSKIKSDGVKKYKRKSILRKKSVKNTISSIEKEFLEWIRSDSQYLLYPCFVCNSINPSDRIEWHHIKELSSDKKNHKRLIPLCGEKHHRNGTELSPHGAPKKWRETYSIEEQNVYAESIWNDFMKYKEGV